jgi:hypothetical protein
MTSQSLVAVVLFCSPNLCLVAQQARQKIETSEQIVRRLGAPRKNDLI